MPRPRAREGTSCQYPVIRCQSAVASDFLRWPRTGIRQLESGNHSSERGWQPLHADARRKTGAWGPGVRANIRPELGTRNSRRVCTVRRQSPEISPDTEGKPGPAPSPTPGFGRDDERATSPATERPPPSAHPQPREREYGGEGQKFARSPGESGFRNSRHSRQQPEMRGNRK